MDRDEKYRLFFENSADAMLIIENDEFVDCNAATVGMLGYVSKREIINTPPFKLSPEFQPDGRTSFEKAAEMIRLANVRGSHQFEWDHLRKDGTIIPVEVSLTAIATQSGVTLHTVWRDLTGRKKTENALRESEERFRQIFATIPDPVILARLEDGTIIDVNKAFQEMSGVSRQEALGRNAEQLGFWKDQKSRNLFYALMNNSEGAQKFEAAFLLQGDQTITGLVSARRLMINNEECLLAVVRDISAEKAAQRALIEMDNLKSEFISTAAHELRTPITGIMGYTELLSDESLTVPLTEEQRYEFRKEIYDGCERLSMIVDDILDVSRIESGQKLPLAKQFVVIDVLINKTAEHFAIKANRRIAVDFRPGTPEGIEVDAHRIRQVLENLVSNAIKYSAIESPISIVTEPDGQFCKVSVADQGIGMTEEQVSRIFDKFYRADTTNTAVSGLGLGMSIVKQIIEGHGGSIWVESVPGKGSRVFFTLPVSDEQK